MAKEWVQHIGDNQLVYGMPKHMSAVAGERIKIESRLNKATVEQDRARLSKFIDSKGDYYWTVHPKPKACEKCQAMAGKEYMEEPERPHPNCKCEINKHPLRKKKRYINGSLTGHSRHVFRGGRQVFIDFQGVSGGLTSGGHVFSNHGHSRQVACPPFTSTSTSLVSDQDAPVDWVIRLKDAGSDNVMIHYTIRYEDWSG